MMEKKVFKFILYIFILGLVAAGLSGCKDINDIRVTSCELVSLSPKGFRSADAVLAIGIYNPAAAFTISDLKGEIFRDSGTAATFSAGTVSVEGKKEGVYRLPCTAEIDKNVSLMELAALAASQDLSGYKVNIEFNVTLGKGRSHRMHFDNIELSDLLK